MIIVAAAGYSIWVWVAGGTTAAGLSAGVGYGAYQLTKTLDKFKKKSSSTPTEPLASAAEQCEQTSSLAEMLTKELRQISASLDTTELHQSLSATLQKITDIYKTLSRLQEESISKPELSGFLNEFMEEVKAVNKKMEVYYEAMLHNQERFKETLHQDAPMFVKLSKMLDRTLGFTAVLQTRIDELELENKSLVKEVTRLEEENQNLRGLLGQANRSQTPVAGFFRPGTEGSKKTMPSTVIPKV